MQWFNVQLHVAVQNSFIANAQHKYIVVIINQLFSHSTSKKSDQNYGSYMTNKLKKQQF